MPRWILDAQPWVDAIAITEATFEKIVLMLLATPGMMAPAATATKPAIRAYSMRSWAWVSRNDLSLKLKIFMTEDTATGYSRE